MINRIKLSKKK